MLLRSRPDTVHRFLLRETQTSTPLIEGSFTTIQPRIGMTPAVADCGYRAPLSPRLHGILTILIFFDFVNYQQTYAAHLCEPLLCTSAARLLFRASRLRQQRLLFCELRSLHSVSVFFLYKNARTSDIKSSSVFISFSASAAASLDACGNVRIFSPIVWMPILHPSIISFAICV